MFFAMTQFGNKVEASPPGETLNFGKTTCFITRPAQMQDQTLQMVEVEHLKIPSIWEVVNFEARVENFESGVLTRAIMEATPIYSFKNSINNYFEKSFAEESAKIFEREAIGKTLKIETSFINVA
jgi:hypothetical protein